MSVIVKGMEMPKDSFMCVLIYPDGSVIDYLTPGGKRLVGTAVPLPEKHGDLIDRTVLEKAVLKWMPHDPCGKQELEFPFETDICVSLMMEIEEQETIAEAEGE